jgi:hypothetical protein
MTQLPKDRAAGSAHSAVVPAALTLAEVLEALALGAHMPLPMF